MPPQTTHLEVAAGAWRDAPPGARIRVSGPLQSLRVARFPDARLSDRIEGLQHVHTLVVVDAAQLADLADAPVAELRLVHCPLSAGAVVDGAACAALVLETCRLPEAIMLSHHCGLRQLELRDCFCLAFLRVTEAPELTRLCLRDCADMNRLEFNKGRTAIILND